MENQKLQGGQFDHADRLFNSVRDTWLSAAGKGNTSDVKELIPEFFYMPEFLENRFNLDLGEKQSGEQVCLVYLKLPIFFFGHLIFLEPFYDTVFGNFFIILFLSIYQFPFATRNLCHVDVLPG